MSEPALDDNLVCFHAQCESILILRCQCGKALCGILEADDAVGRRVASGSGQEAAAQKGIVAHHRSVYGHQLVHRITAGRQLFKIQVLFHCPLHHSAEEPEQYTEFHNNLPLCGRVISSRLQPHGRRQNRADLFIIQFYTYTFSA